MSYRAQAIDTGRAQRVFGVLETTANTRVAPAASNGLLPIGALDFSQPIPGIMDAQARATLSQGDTIQGTRPKGSGSLDVYLPLSGALGTPPQWRYLMKSLMGREVVTGGTSVVWSPYLFNADPITLTMWYASLLKQRVLSGVIVTGATIKFGAAPSAPGSVLQASFNFEGVELRRFSKCYVNADADELDTTIDVRGGYAEKGARVRFNVDGTILDNTGAGYEITAVSSDGHTLTLDPALEADLHPTTPGTSTEISVEPWTPGVTEVGKPAHAAIGRVTIGGTTVRMLSGQVNITNGWTVYDDTQRDDEFPNAEYGGENMRDVTFELDLYDKAQLGFIQKYHVDHTAVAVNFEVKNRSGVDAFKIELARCFVEDFMGSGEGGMKAKVKGRAVFNSTYDNEILIKTLAPSF